MKLSAVTSKRLPILFCTAVWLSPIGAKKQQRINPQKLDCDTLVRLSVGFLNRLVKDLERRRGRVQYRGFVLSIPSSLVAVATSGSIEANGNDDNVDDGRDNNDDDNDEDDDDNNDDDDDDDDNDDEDDDDHDDDDDGSDNQEEESHDNDSDTDDSDDAQDDHHD